MSGVINQSYIVRINSLNDRACAEYDRLSENLNKIREKIKGIDSINDGNSIAYDRLVQAEKQLNIKMIKIDSLKIELESKKVQYQALLHDKDELLKSIAKKEEQYEDGIKATFASALNMTLSIIGYFNEKTDVNLTNLVSAIFPLAIAIYFIVNSIIKRKLLDRDLERIERKKLVFDDENFKILNDKLALNLGEYLNDKDIKNYLNKLNKSIEISESLGSINIKNDIIQDIKSDISDLRIQMYGIHDSMVSLPLITHHSNEPPTNDQVNTDSKYPYFQTSYDAEDIEHRSKLESSRPNSEIFTPMRMSDSNIKLIDNLSKGDSVGVTIKQNVKDNNLNDDRSNTLKLTPIISTNLDEHLNNNSPNEDDNIELQDLQKIHRKSSSAQNIRSSN